MGRCILNILILKIIEKKHMLTRICRFDLTNEQMAVLESIRVPGWDSSSWRKAVQITFHVLEGDGRYSVQQSQSLYSFMRGCLKSVYLFIYWMLVTGLSSAFLDSFSRSPPPPAAFSLSLFSFSFRLQATVARTWIGQLLRVRKSGIALITCPVWPSGKWHGLDMGARTMELLCPTCGLFPRKPSHLLKLPSLHNRRPAAFSPLPRFLSCGLRFSTFYFFCYTPATSSPLCPYMPPLSTPFLCTSVRRGRTTCANVFVTVD